MPIYNTGKQKNGKAQYRVFVNFTDSNGKLKRKTKCVYGLREAQATEKKLSSEVQESGTGGNMTLQQLYDEYIAVKEHEVRRSTLEKTKSVLGNHVMNTDLPQKRLDKISKTVLQDWKNSLAKKDIKVSTKNNAIRDFNAMLNYAVKMDYIIKNPLKDIGKFKDAYFQVAEEKIHYYTPEQFKKYIGVAKANRDTLTDYGCYIFFLLAFYTGMRKGELNALKWSDLDGNTIHVRRSICQKVKGGYEETPPKNKASYRSLQLPKKVIKELDEYRDVLNANVQYSESLRMCGGFKPIPDTVLENHNTFYAESAGLPHIRIHDFRHSHASLLINENINIMEISRRLGHSDVKMTWNTYGHLYPKIEEQVLSVLEKACV